MSIVEEDLGFYTTIEDLTFDILLDIIGPHKTYMHIHL